MRALNIVNCVQETICVAAIADIVGSLLSSTHAAIVVLRPPRDHQSEGAARGQDLLPGCHVVLHDRGVPFCFKLVKSSLIEVQHGLCNGLPWVWPGPMSTCFGVSNAVLV